MVQTKTGVAGRAVKGSSARPHRRPENTPGRGGGARKRTSPRVSASVGAVRAAKTDAPSSFVAAKTVPAVEGVAATGVTKRRTPETAGRAPSPVAAQDKAVITFLRADARAIRVVPRRPTDARRAAEGIKDQAVEGAGKGRPAS